MNYLQKAHAYLDEKREKNKQEIMIEHIKSQFKDFGMKSIKIGSESIELEETKSSLTLSQEEQDWTDELNKGASLFVISVHSDNVGYLGKEDVQFNNQKLSDLIDENLVQQLAPSAKIYAPRDNAPWKDIIEVSSFKVFIKNKSEFENLWSHLGDWVKTDWHDNVTHTKYQHKAENIFQISVYYDIQPDLSWRNAQYKRAEKNLEKMTELGHWDAAAQTELKQTLASLLRIENHPLIGSQMTPIINNLTTLLAKSMEGKDFVQEEKNKVDKLQKILYKGFKLLNISWKDRYQILLIQEKTKKLKK